MATRKRKLQNKSGRAASSQKKRRMNSDRGAADLDFSYNPLPPNYDGPTPPRPYRQRTPSRSNSGRRRSSPMYSPSESSSDAENSQSPSRSTSPRQTMPAQRRLMPNLRPSQDSPPYNPLYREQFSPTNRNQRVGELNTANRRSHRLSRAKSLHTKTESHCLVRPFYVDFESMILPVVCPTANAIKKVLSLEYSGLVYLIIGFIVGIILCWGGLQMLNGGGGERGMGYGHKGYTNPISHKYYSFTDMTGSNETCPCDTTKFGSIGHDLLCVHIIRWFV